MKIVAANLKTVYTYYVLILVYITIFRQDIQVFQTYICHLTFHKAKLTKNHQQRKLSERKKIDMKRGTP